MSRAKAGKKKSKGSGRPRPAARPRVAEEPRLNAEILPAGGAVRKSAPPAPKAEPVETGEKSFYGETAPEMLRRVRRELRNIGILAVISFGVGLLFIQFVKF